MNKRVPVVLLLISLLSTLIGEDFSLKGENYLISETKKGYLDFSIVGLNGKTVPVLDSGTYLNSRIYIKDSDKRFYLRDQARYVVNITKSQLIIKWRVLTLDIIESYTKSNNGVLYNIEVNNRTDKDRNVGVYLMFDTYLGEEEKDHFVVDDYKVINREKVYHFGDIPQSLKSINSLGQGIEFRFRDENTTTPDDLILGNWEQLARSKKWPYNPKDGSFFSYGYYSVNDSGVGVVYSSKSVPAEDNIEYSFNINFISEQVKTVEEVEVKVKEVTEESKWDHKEFSEPKDTPIIEDVPTVNESTVFLEEENISVEEENISVEEETDIVIEETKTEVFKSEEISIEEDNIIDPEKEELMRMLEYIQKKKNGEDVSGYDFDEGYIMKKLKERNE